MADEVEQVLRTGTRVAVKIVVTTAHLSAHLVRAAVRTYLRHRQQAKHQGEQSLKNLNAQGKQLDHVDISRSDLREIRAQMKKYAVDFSVLREPGTDTYHLYFKAQDADRLFQGMEKAAAAWTKDQDVSREQPQDKVKEPREKGPEKEPWEKGPAEVKVSDLAKDRVPMAEQLADAAKEAATRNAAVAAARAAVKVAEVSSTKVMEESL